MDRDLSKEMADYMCQTTKPKEYSLKEVIGISLGEASMAWSKTPKGVFNSTLCSQLLDRIVIRVEEEKKKAQIEILEEIKMRYCKDEHSSMNNIINMKLNSLRKR